jgi:endogenous inhibitor of DNA gyrase (YacG/DUF329 family)
MPKCSTCGKPVEWRDNPWRPFCSERCQLIDFGRWTDEDYRVPGRQINPSEIPTQSQINEENDFEQAN